MRSWGEGNPELFIAAAFRRNAPQTQKLLDDPERVRDICDDEPVPYAYQYEEFTSEEIYDSAGLPQPKFALRTLPLPLTYATVQSNTKFSVQSAARQAAERVEAEVLKVGPDCCQLVVALRPCLLVVDNRLAVACVIVPRALSCSPKEKLTLTS